MPNTAINAPPGYYTSAQIINIAETHFPDVYNTLLNPAELAWDTVNIPGFYYPALFVGYIKIAGVLHKVLACMASSHGSMHFFTRAVFKLSRADMGRTQLIAPWSFVAVGETGVARPRLLNVVALCQFAFAATGVSAGVMAKKGWFRALEMSCRLAGQDMGMLVCGETRLGGGEDGGYEGGDEEGAAPGMQVGKSARIVQRLVVFVKRANGHWGNHVEQELKGAWPGLKKHWRK